MIGYFALFTLAACSLPSYPDYDECLDIKGYDMESVCSKKSGCKYYGRLNNGGACITKDGRNDPKADSCHVETTQSSCGKTYGCKWYGKKTGDYRPKCVTEGGINDPKSSLHEVATNPQRGFLARWLGWWEEIVETQWNIAFFSYVHVRLNLIFQFTCTFISYQIFFLCVAQFFFLWVRLDRMSWILCVLWGDWGF